MSDSYDTWNDALDDADADGTLVWQLALEKRAKYDGFYVVPDDDATTNRIERFPHRAEVKPGRPLRRGRRC